jgi:hypothetical protein
VTNGLAIQPTFMLSQAAEHEGWQSPPFPHAETSPYWASGESTPNPSAFQQMAELTPTSSGPPFAGPSMTYPQQQWAAQGRSASFGQLEGSVHHGFGYPVELAATDLAAAAASLQYPLTHAQGLPALTAAERANPGAAAAAAALLASHAHMAPPPPGFAYAPPQAWMAQPPGASPWFSEPSPLTEPDPSEHEGADPFASAVSPVYPNRQNTG